MEETKIVITDCGNGVANISIEGSSVIAAVMLTAALVETIHDCRDIGVTNEQLADEVRSMVLEGLEEMSNAGK